MRCGWSVDGSRNGVVNLGGARQPWSVPASREAGTGRRCRTILERLVYRPYRNINESISMSTILFAWQLGGGYGHLMQMLPLVRGLIKRGHKVFLAMKDLSATSKLGPLHVALLQ